MWSFFLLLFCSRLFVFVFVFVFCRSSGKEKNFSVNFVAEEKEKKEEEEEDKKKKKREKKKKRFFCVLLDVLCGVASSSLLLVVVVIGGRVSFEDIYTKKKKTSCTSLHEGKSRDLARRRRKTWR